MKPASRRRLETFELGVVDGEAQQDAKRITKGTISRRSVLTIVA